MSCSCDADFATILGQFDIQASMQLDDNLATSNSLASAPPLRDAVKGKADDSGDFDRG
jgi:hypothetical protein